MIYDRLVNLAAEISCKRLKGGRTTPAMILGGEIRTFTHFLVEATELGLHAFAKDYHFLVLRCQVVDLAQGRSQLLSTSKLQSVITFMSTPQIFTSFPRTCIWSSNPARIKYIDLSRLDVSRQL